MAGLQKVQATFPRDGKEPWLLDRQTMKYDEMLPTLVLDLDKAAWKASLVLLERELFCQHRSCR